MPGAALAFGSTRSGQSLYFDISTGTEIPMQGEWSVANLSLALRQVILSPVQPLAASAALDFLGFHLEINGACAPALVVDLSARPIVAVTLLQATGAAATLSTDLWMKQDGVGTEATRDVDASGQRPTDPLLSLIATATPGGPDFALIAFEDGRPTFFRSVRNLGSPPDGALVLHNVVIRTTTSRIALDDWASQLTLDVKANLEKAERLLPFLGSPKPPDDGSGSGSFAEKLGQYIKVKQKNPAPVAHPSVGKAELPVEVEIHLPGMEQEAITTTLTLEVDVTTLGVAIHGDKVLTIRGPTATFNILGLAARVAARPGRADAKGEFDQFVLDFSTGEPRMALSPDATVELSYGKIAASGRGLVFKVDSFAVAKGVFDVEARVDPDIPVPIAGIDMPFRFVDGGVSIKRGKLQAFSIKGTGQLPPALVGEANATIRLAFNTGRGGQVVLQSAEAELDKSADP